MDERKETDRQVVVEHKDSTEVWEKDSAGSTTKEGYSRYYKDTGDTIDYYGKIISTGGRDGHKEPKK